MQERFKTFTVLMTRITRCIRKLKTEEMKEWGLKSHHVSCLYYLYRSDSLTATELGEICEEDKAALSRAIEYLEDNGYITCNSKTQKRYRSPLELTEKGREAGRRISEKVDAVLGATAEGVSDDERRVMYRSLERICLNLEKLCEKY